MYGVENSHNILILLRRFRFEIPYFCSGLLKIIAYEHERSNIV